MPVATKTGLTKSWEEQVNEVMETIHPQHIEGPRGVLGMMVPNGIDPADAGWTDDLGHWFRVFNYVRDNNIMKINFIVPMRCIQFGRVAARHWCQAVKRSLAIEDIPNDIKAIILAKIVSKAMLITGGPAEFDVNFTVRIDEDEKLVCDWFTTPIGLGKAEATKHEFCFDPGIIP